MLKVFLFILLLIPIPYRKTDFGELNLKIHFDPNSFILSDFESKKLDTIAYYMNDYGYSRDGTGPRIYVYPSQSMGDTLRYLRYKEIEKIIKTNSKFKYLDDVFLNWNNGPGSALLDSNEVLVYLK